MGYYTRVFCLSGNVPPLNKVFEWVKKRGILLKVAPDFADVDLNSPNWEQIGIIYKSGKLPFLSECNRDDGSEASLLRKELDEFIEFLEDVEDSPAKNKVLRHLRNTKFVIANQIPTSDFDEDGYDANGEFLNYFVEHCGGMIQADGEGFYEGATLIVELG